MQTEDDMPEYKAMEPSVEASESLLRAVLEATADGILVVNRTRRITAYNRRFAELWNLPANLLDRGSSEEALNVACRQLAEPNQFVNMVEQLNATPDANSFDVVHFSDGRVFESSSQPQRLGTEIIGRVWSFRDITFRENSLQDLRKREARYRAVIETSADGFWVVSPTGQILEVNEAYLRRSGYAREEVIGKHIPDIEAYEKPEETAASIEQVMRDGSGIFEAHHRAKDGAVWPVEINTVYWPIDGGYFLVFIRDITGRKQAEETLRTSEEHYRTLYNAIGDAVVVHEIREGGLPGRFLEVNNVACERLGYARDELLRMTPEDIDAPDSGVDAKSIGLRVRGGETVTFEQVHIAKDGRRIPVEIRAQAFNLRGRAEVLSLVRDITERKRIEAELEHYRKHLEEVVAERTAGLKRANQELESFSYSVSHDLRAPLRTIIGLAQALLDTESKVVSEKGRYYLDRIVRNAARMGQLIDDMLKVSRVSRTELKMLKVDMESLARASLFELADEYPKAQVKIGVLPPAVGDGNLLKQVFTNLIGNALKYSSKREKPEVEIGAQQQDGTTVYFVRDNGAGFDMAYADRLFGVFQRMHSDAEFPGTGIGLAIVKHIVERHRGRVWAEAAADRGATFYFTLAFNEGNLRDHID
jgi:PAS domain S-box-containing protein